MKTIVCIALLCVADPETCHLPPLSLADGLPAHAACVQARDLAQRESCRLKRFSNELWEWREYPGYENWSWTVWAQHQSQQERADIWTQVEIATNHCASEYDRRQALANLIRWLDWRPVITGELPPPIPLE